MGEYREHDTTSFGAPKCYVRSPSGRVILRRICSTGKRLRKSATLLPPLRPRRASTRARRSSYRFTLRSPCSKSSSTDSLITSESSARYWNAELLSPGIPTSSDSPSNTSSCLRDATGSTCGAFPTKKRRSPGSGTVGGHWTGACGRSHGGDRSDASIRPDATWKASVWVRPDAFPPEGRPGPATLQGRPHAGRYFTTGSATGSRLFTDRSIASVTSSVHRASRAVARAQGLPSAR